MEIIPIVIGLTEIIKKTGKVDMRFIQLIAIIIGIVLFCIGYFFPDVSKELFVLLAGIASPGIYSAGKGIVKANK